MSNELNEFVQFAKFKTSGTGAFIYFNPNADYQIRICNNGLKGIKRSWYTTLHKRNEDGITFDAAISQEMTKYAQEAKIIAAKLYFTITN